MKSHTFAAQLCACVLLVGTPLGASAARDYNGPLESRFYLGGGVGYDKLEGEDFTNNGGGSGIEDERVTYKGIVGLRGKVVSLEAQYIDFGTAEDGNNRVNAHGISADILLDFPLNDVISPYGKIGALFWDADGRFAGVSGRDDGTDFTYGAGVRFTLGPNVDLRTEYEAFELNETDIDHLALVLQFNF